MPPIGFSTGSLARGDFQTGLDLARQLPTDVIELSALRMNELVPLTDAARDLDVDGFEYVAVHAPGRFSAAQEADVAERLHSLDYRDWPVVLHPDTIHSFDIWRTFGDRLLIENMDKRKRCGRTSAELTGIFEQLPNARLCFDIAHARQVDASMLEAFRILRDWRDRLAHIHISEVATSSRHARISWSAVHDFQEVASLIPRDVPVILETPVDLTTAEAELARARRALEVPTMAGT